MPVIICNINTFDYYQTVYLYYDQEDFSILGQTTFENLDHFIVTHCGENEIDKVILRGSTYYTIPLKKRIEKENIARYNKRIEVEINE